MGFVLTWSTPREYGTTGVIGTVAVVVATAGTHAQRLHSTAARLAVAVVPAVGGGAGAAPAATDGHSHLQKVLLLVPHFLTGLGFL
jgi:hypothetical protein